MEITVTGANALTDPSLRIWGWTVALYLFLVGTAAGLLVMSAAGNLKGGVADLRDRADLIGAAKSSALLLALGILLIWLDLDNKSQSYRFLLSFTPTSAMSWGGWCLAVTLPVTVLYAVSVMPERGRPRPLRGSTAGFSRKLKPYSRLLAVACLAFGILLGLYAGLVLSVFTARPFWNSPVLPVLSLASALSCGAGVIVLMSQRDAVRLCFTRANIALIVTEMLLLGLFLLGHLTSGGPKRDGVLPFFSPAHEYFPYGIAFLLAALLLPLFLVMSVPTLKQEGDDRIPRAALFRVRLSAWMSVAGGFILRLALVYLGQLSSLS